MLHRAEVPSYYLAPFVTATAMRNGAKTDSASLVRTKETYPNAADKWRPKHYKLVFRAKPDAVFLGFIGKELPREVFADEYVFGDDQHAIPELRALWGYYTPAAAKKLKLDLKVVYEEKNDRKHPGLEITTTTPGNILRLRGTHIPQELFPFPLYMEANKAMHEPKTWKKVTFDSGRRTVTVEYRTPPVTRTYGDKVGESINPMQWAGQAWKTFEALATGKMNLDDLELNSVKEANIGPEMLKPDADTMPIIFHESKPERDTLKTNLLDLVLF